jgi:hypothetical protein
MPTRWSTSTAAPSKARRRARCRSERASCKRGAGSANLESDLPSEHAYGLGEPVLGSRPRLGERDRNLAGVGTVAALVLVAVVGVLLGIGLLGGDDRDGRGGDRARAERLAEQRERKAAREREQRREQQAEQSAQQVALRLDLNSDVQVCLVGDSGQALVDSQVLTAGTEESFEAGSFDLRFPSGYDREQFDLFLGGERARVPETQGPTAFRLTPPAEIEQVTFPGLACP